MAILGTLSINGIDVVHVTHILLFHQGIVQFTIYNQKFDYILNILLHDIFIFMTFYNLHDIFTFHTWKYKEREHK